MFRQRFVYLFRQKCFAETVEPRFAEFDRSSRIRQPAGLPDSAKSAGFGNRRPGQTSSWPRPAKLLSNFLAQAHKTSTKLPPKSLETSTAHVCVRNKNSQEDLKSCLYLLRATCWRADFTYINPLQTHQPHRKSQPQTSTRRRRNFHQTSSVQALKLLSNFLCMSRFRPQNFYQTAGSVEEVWRKLSGSFLGLPVTSPDPIFPNPADFAARFRRRGFGFGRIRVRKFDEFGKT